MGDDELRELLAELKQQQQEIREKLEPAEKPRKDRWDKLSAVSPIVSGLLIASSAGVMAGYFTYSYNQQQLRLQEIQTIERFIPHMLGNEQEKKAAILAISSLANTKLAARFASLFASEGTVSALESIASRGDARDRTIANQALDQALVNIAEDYSVSNRLEEAEQAYKKALEVAEKTSGSDDPDIVYKLNRLAELYMTNGKYHLAEPLLKRSLAINEKLYGPDAPTLAGTLKNLSELYRLEGNRVEADRLYKRALAIDNRAGLGAAAARNETAAATHRAEEAGAAHRNDTEAPAAEGQPLDAEPRSGAEPAHPASSEPSRLLPQPGGKAVKPDEHDPGTYGNRGVEGQKGKSKPLLGSRAEASQPPQ